MIAEFYEFIANSDIQGCHPIDGSHISLTHTKSYIYIPIICTYLSGPSTQCLL